MAEERWLQERVRAVEEDSDALCTGRALVEELTDQCASLIAAT